MSKEEFNIEPEWTPEEKFRHLLRVHEAANNAILQLEERLRQAQDRIRFLESQVENAQQNVLQQKQIVKHNLEQTAAEKRELEQEIMELRARLKKG